MSINREEREQAPALVVDRWNSWVRVWFPDSGDMHWVNLDETEYEPLDESDSEEPAASPERRLRDRI
jgi:hypothetical protein